MLSGLLKNDIAIGINIMNTFVKMHNIFKTGG